MDSPKNTILDDIQRKYEDRKNKIPGNRYFFLDPSVFLPWQERERTFISFLRNHQNKQKPLSELAFLEIGCGFGTNILQFLRFGFSPDKITANELLPDRASAARERLPEKIVVICGDAAEVDFPNAPFDLILVSTVFSSLLNPYFRKKLALRIWDILSPGGAILWYDFIYNNPSNPDVTGIPIKELKRCFPYGEIIYKKTTLAPPLARSILPRAPWNWLYSFLNLPFLRTHLTAWIQKGLEEPNNENSSN